MPAVVEKMVHFGEMPWHGDSEELTGNETSREVMQKAGLDWNVVTKPLFMEDGTAVPAQAFCMAGGAGRQASESHWGVTLRTR